ncbi:MAG: hypothetical protein Q8P56_01545 [Candidatus Uhrbacteria bacterium]|nr:hypothetical protein [Candidatus Uhrbacteria bacterium]
MYTNGIRKISCTLLPGGTIEKAQEVALKAGFRAMLFNNQVYIFVAKQWYLTPFIGDDFQDL